MKATERIVCKGHKNITAQHRTTFEVTCEDQLTLQGDCIIGVGADRSAADLGSEFRTVMTSPHSVLTTRLRCEGHELEIRSSGDPGLSLTHPTDLVWRKSEFVCARTIGIRTNAAARDLPRDFVESLANGAVLIVELIAECPDSG
ncbi:hypothetical protein J2741_002250 [Methanolinea mesophila]|uniref:DUF371 domain-containing protein n=1 Tax=Methanolinea mesophila TaxID=547055 RepID=UPI001AE67DEF|nr:DUF371 domain-containing protein [Methanolinea mesophila]MBP1929703.1 hypothetical protein [Methanolinea mesophila]